jgi:hypothetical protein
MAIASALRRAPRAAALLAALGSRAGGRVHPLHRRAAHVSPFSSIPAPQPSAADAQLLRVINFEISSAQSECRKPNWVLVRFLYSHLLQMVLIYLFENTAADFGIVVDLNM